MTTIRVATYALNDRRIVDTVGSLIEVLDYSRQKNTITVAEEICGEEQNDGAICIRDPTDCQYHT